MRTQTSEKLTFTAAEAAKQLGISLPVLYRLCGRPDFPSVRVGRKLIIYRVGLERWLEEQAGGKGMIKRDQQSRGALR